MAAYTVTLEHADEQVLAAARTRTTYGRVSAEIGALLGAPWRLVRGPRADLWEHGSNVAVYWGPPPNGSIEVGVQVVARFADTADVVCTIVPAGTVAKTTHVGAYAQLGAAHDAVRAWCGARGMRVSVFWEVYGDWFDDPALVKTDVCYLVADEAAL